MTSSSLASSSSANHCDYYPTDILEKNSKTKICLIVLNGEDTCPCIKTYLDLVWPKSVMQILVDGGANRVRHVELANKRDYIPTVICGDMDSCTDSVLQLYKAKKTEIIKDTDQNSTDFTKCVKLYKDRYFSNGKKADAILALGGLCSRFDHVIACVQTLHLAQSQINLPIPLYLLHNESMVVLLRPGKSSLHLNRRILTGKCGFAPINAPANQVATTGLKWNLANQKMAFGHLISTSNEIVADRVDISADTPLLWTMEIDKNAVLLRAK